jgi:hypothetical protein
VTSRRAASTRCRLSSARSILELRSSNLIIVLRLIGIIILGLILIALVLIVLVVAEIGCT